MLRGDISQDDDLLEYAETISGALKKKPLENGIVCYRRSNVQGYGNVKRGDILYPKQFVSTSVIRSRTLQGEYETVIFAPQGTLGAFLDKGISRMPNQREFLLDKDCKFRVISNKDNRLILQVEVN